MMNTIEVILIALGSSVATGFGQWFFFRRKNTADAVSAEINNYRLIIDDLKKAAEDWQKQAENYRCLYINSTIEIDQLKTTVRKLQSEVNQHKNEIDKLKKL